MKFSGEFCSNIESISTIWPGAWNKTNSSSQMSRFLGDFLGMVGVLNKDGWLILIYFTTFHNFFSKWSIDMTEWAVGNQCLRFTKQVQIRFISWYSWKRNEALSCPVLLPVEQFFTCNTFINHNLWTLSIYNFTFGKTYNFIFPCKFAKKHFFMNNMYATIFTFFRNLIYQKFIQNTSFSLTTFSLPKVKSYYSFY